MSQHEDNIKWHQYEITSICLMELLWHCYDKVNTNDDDNFDSNDSDRDTSSTADIVIWYEVIISWTFNLMHQTSFIPVSKQEGETRFSIMESLIKNAKRMKPMARIVNYSWKFRKYAKQSNQKYQNVLCIFFILFSAKLEKILPPTLHLNSIPIQ